MKFGIAKIFILMLTICLASWSAPAVDWETHMGDVPPEIKNHLLAVLELIGSTERGKFVLEHVSPNLEFRVRPMAKWGEADTRNEITLEALRLTSSALPQGSEHEIRVKECFTAEILTHELLHNAQFQAGLFRYPANAGGVEASMCEMLLELEAKYYGEAMFDELRQRPEFQEFVQPKSGLFLVMARQSQSPEKEYAEALWTNGGSGTPAIKLYREQLSEIRNWHSAYVQQAFQNNFRRFLADGQGAGKAALTEHLAKIIAFANMDISAEFLVLHAAVEPVPHGIASLENGTKKFEFEACSADRAVLRKYLKGTVQEQAISPNR